MHTRNDRKHPALKHGAFSATAVLPGESRAEFEKLHRDLVAEFSPSGALEDDVVMIIARFVWRRQNLATLRIAGDARAHLDAVEQKFQIEYPRLPLLYFEEEESVRVNREQGRQVAIEKAQEELGGLYELTEIAAATFDGLTKELEIQDRLDTAINKCLKQLLLVRGVKSMTVAPPSASPKRVTGPQKPPN